MDTSTTIYPTRIATAVALLGLFAGAQAFAQVPVDNNGSPVESLGASSNGYADASYESGIEPLTTAELETLVGPIALYPDDLLAIVLPASTYPLQIVQAARFLEAFEGDSALKPDESWDESVIALINYPEVIQLLNDDIDWTWRLGEAVISQQQQLVVAVESFRNRAYAAGNLKSDDYQTISIEDDIIEIVPIEDDVIYVPYYEPERVIVRQSRPVYYYYDRPYPVYYYPYPAGHAFTSGYFWGVTTAFRIGWASDRLRVQHASYWGHPYYGHHYYGHYYRRPSIAHYNTVYVNNARQHSAQRYRRGDYWRPHRSSGARQSDYLVHARNYRNDTQRVRHSSNRTSTTRTRSDDARHDRTNYTATSSRSTSRNRTQRSTSQRPAPAHVARNVGSDRRQSEQRTLQRATHGDANRSRPQQRQQRQTRNEATRTRPQHRPQRQTRSEATQSRPQQRPPRQTRKEAPRTERSSGQRSEKSESASKRKESKRSSSRNERRRH